jgi:LPXTG-site transpeptidase (sortase) family protein
MFDSKIGKLISAIGVVLIMSSMAGIFSALRQPAVDPVEAAFLELIVPLEAETDLQQVVDGETYPLPGELIYGTDQPGEDHVIAIDADSESPPPTNGQKTWRSPSSTKGIASSGPEIPQRLVIHTIGLDAPVISAESQTVTIMGNDYKQWSAPNKFAAGWHTDSARLGETGNIVLNGHNNLYGEVFIDLEKLQPGDLIWVYSANNVYQYMVTNSMLLLEKYQDLEVRLDNAKWLLPSQDERLTLVTCWPYVSNTHRLIIVAKPHPFDEPAKKID